MVRDARRCRAPHDGFGIGPLALSSSAARRSHDVNGAIRKHPRGSICPSLAVAIAPLRMEGAGNAGCRPHPWPACNKKSRRQSPQVQPKQPAFPARWFMAYTSSPRCPGLLATVICRIIADKLDPSVGGSGPHDFAIRIGIARRTMPQRPSRPAPDVRDDREPPLQWVRDAQGKPQISGKRKWNFCGARPMREIGLRSLDEFDFSRSGFAAGKSPFQCPRREKSIK